MPSGWQLERWQQRAYRVWTIVGILLLVAVGAWALSKISAALIPFVMAFVLVFLLAWPVRLLEGRGLSRGASSGLAILGLLVVVGLAFTFVIPVLAKQLTSLAVQAPRYIATAEKEIGQIESSLRSLVLPEWARRFISEAFKQLATGITALGKSAATSILAIGSQALTLIIDGFIALVITFWALRDLPTIREEILLVADKRRDDVEMLFGQIGKSMGGYLKGQTIASLCTGLLSMIGLFIVGIPYAFLLGSLAFVLNYIPYVGPFITGLVAALVGLFISPMKAVLGIAVVIAAQQITDNLITPRVMASEVNLHPTLVIFSLLVGGSLFGIPGMLFAIPIAAALQGAFIYYFERATSSQLASAEGALFRSDECDDDSGEPCEPGAESTDADVTAHAETTADHPASEAKDGDTDQ
jgi:predicted PurR-regulated permease PerM